MLVESEAVSEDLLAEVLALDAEVIPTISSQIKFDPERRYRELLMTRKEGSQFLIVRKGTLLAGYIEVVLTGNKEAYVTSLQIRPEMQRTMVASDLLAQLIDFLRHIPSAIVSTQVSFINSRSIELHKHLGFHEAGSMGEYILYQTSASELIGKYSAVMERQLRTRVKDPGVEGNGKLLQVRP